MERELTLAERLARPIGGPRLACSDERLISRLKAARRIWLDTGEPRTFREIDRLLDELNRRRAT